MNNAVAQLYIGNRNYSSWSLRPWLLLRYFGVDFETEVIPLDTPDFKRRVVEVSPSLRVPVLVDGDIRVWDSLAIALYAAERWSQIKLWPENLGARAMAMAITAEMHSGFTALRIGCPMNIRRRVSTYAVPEQALSDAERIKALWNESRRRFGTGGDFLFGAFSLADAFYAPVVTRFLTYGVALDTVAQTYVEAMMCLPAMREWCAAAAVESWGIEATDRMAT